MNAFLRHAQLRRQRGFAGVASPASGSYPNQPVGYTRICETDYSELPDASLPQAGGGGVLRSPSNLITINGALGLDYDYIAGTVPGYDPPSYALFWMWYVDNYLSGREYSKLYVRDEFTLVGNSGNFETPPSGHKMGYFGYGLNNQNGSGAGPVQGYTMFTPIVTVGSFDPIRASEFRISIRTQITGSSPGNRDLAQNLNLGTHIVVGTRHVLERLFMLNDAGSANGIARWWLDGTQLGEYTDVRWIDSSYANAGYGAKADGLAGFFGLYYDPVWGGSGGANKTRSDIMRWHNTYASGEFLREANP